MAEIKVRACDACGATPADVWRIGKDGSRFYVDLCGQCAMPLVNLQSAGRPEARPKRPITKFKLSEDLNVTERDQQ